MEEIIQILIFVGAMVIAVVGQNAKNKKKPMTASPQETLEDMFPEIEIQGNEEVAPQPIPNPSLSKKKAVAKRQTPPRTNAPVTPITASRKEKKISLNTRQEARRAFIYSEIFNRKY
ncbi:MAG: hypothetical protein IJX29_00240 [Bacteroides sp.]|nr:hypothetical protein [Bacteroides sp.]